MPEELFHKMERDTAKKRDYSLVKSTLRGKKEAFGVLMSYYKKRVFLFGKSFFHNETDAEDFVQDVFIKVYTNLKSFKGKAAFSTWLMRIAYTTAVNSKNRKKDFLPIMDEDLIPASSLSPEELQIRQITREAIRSAIKELPEKFAVCVEMYFSYDMTYQEISEVTEIPVNTLKSHVFRAKKILKDKLEVFHEK